MEAVVAAAAAAELASGGLASSGDDDQKEVCRDFLRSACRKGDKCIYKHPVQDIVALIDLKSVCHDFQNRGCSRQSCRYVHVTVEEEKFIRETGKPPSTMEPNRRHTLTGDVEMCGDYMKGRCNRGDRCKFRHGDSGRSYDAMIAATPRYDPYSRIGPREHRSAARPGFQDSAMLEEEIIVLKEQMIKLRRQVVDLTLSNDDLVAENQRLKQMVSGGGQVHHAGYGTDASTYSAAAGYNSGAQAMSVPRPAGADPTQHGGYY